MKLFSVLNWQCATNTDFYLTQNTLLKQHSLGYFYNICKLNLAASTLKCMTIVDPAQQTKIDPLACLCKMEVFSCLVSSSGEIKQFNS